VGWVIPAPYLLFVVLTNSAAVHYRQYHDNDPEEDPMASITTLPFVRHLRASATSHIQHLSGGTVRHSAAGASFWFRPLTAAISEVPIDDREQEVLVRVRAADLQEVTAPGTVTYRFVRPDVAASRIDFSVDLGSGTWLERPLERVGSSIHGATSAAVTTALSGLSLSAILALDPAELGATVAQRLATDDRLTSVGIAVIGVRFNVLRPDSDVERALQTPAREVIQQEADRATYERRALAVEREAAIGENELANQIELAKRQEHLIAQKGANARKTAEDAAAADAIAAEAEAARTTALAAARAEAERAIGQATADTERAKLTAYDGASRDLLLALALRELAGNLPSIEQVVLTPDMVTGLLGRLTAAPHRS
jgi:regulator of protease activity HflC (stomatin/prohibitin superfamily)